MHVKRWLVSLLFCAVFGASLVPGAQAGGLPSLSPACGTTITSSFKLSASKTCNANGYIIGKSGVTIDLGGHTLTGDGQAQDAGIRILNGPVKISDAVIRNGALRNFGVGVDLAAPAKDTLVQNITAVDNSFYGISVSGDGDTIKKNTIAANYIGLEVGPFGSKAAIVGNIIGHNQRYGMAVSSSGKLKIARGNTIAGNGEEGIRSFGNGGTYEKNTIAGNGTTQDDIPAMRMGGDHNTATKNQIFGNTAVGYADEGDDNTFSFNTVQGNGYFDGDDDGDADSDAHSVGVQLVGATNAHAKKNKVQGNDATFCPSLCKTIKGDKDLPEFTPACNGLVTFSFRLGNDKFCSGAGFRVGAPGITIDLAGHTLSGDGGDSDYGIVNDYNVAGSGHDGVTIRNGVVRGFGQGIRLFEVDDNLVTGVVLAANDTGVLLRGQGVTLAKSTVAGSLDAGVAGVAGTVAITGNRSANNEHGITIQNIVTDGTVTSNAILGNYRNGIGSQGDSIEFTSNIVAGNGTEQAVPAVQLTDSGIGNVLKKNVVSANGDGVYDESGATAYTKNVVNGNGYVVGFIGDGLNASGVPFVSGSDNVAIGNENVQCDPASLCA